MCNHFATAPFLFPYFFFLNITNQVISRYERGVTGVPGCGAHHVAVFVDELAGFYFSEEFFGISSYVGGDDFVAYDLALGIDDEGSSLGFFSVLGEDVKGAGEDLAGVTDPGEFYFSDGLGVVVPCFVDVDGVAGDGVDFTADLLECFVVVLEVLEFGRADEGEVSRIEEEYAPFPFRSSLVTGRNS